MRPDRIREAFNWDDPVIYRWVVEWEREPSRGLAMLQAGGEALALALAPAGATLGLLALVKLASTTVSFWVAAVLGAVALLDYLGSIVASLRGRATMAWRAKARNRPVLASIALACHGVAARWRAYDSRLQRGIRPTRYRCLILDHDDTAVDGSRRVHYPAHVRAMEILRPGQAPVDLDTWFCRNFEPGIMPFLVDELGLTPEEMAVEHRIWQEFTSRETPRFYPGFLDALAAYKARGGSVAVVSHSEKNVILTHYRKAGDGHGVEPDLVYGWDFEAHKRKPSPYPVRQILRQLHLEPRDVLVVDDLKPGVLMAQAAGVDAAAVGWGHDIPAIRGFMQRTCVAYLATVPEFAEFILR